MPGDRLTYRRRIDATPDAVRVVLNDLCLVLSALSVAQDETATVELVLAEVLNNIVEHAYQGVPAGPIEIEVTSDDCGLEVRLCDWGLPMPGGQLPPGACPGMAAIPGDTPEGGYGWFLIRALASDLSYVRLEGRNLLGFHLDLARAVATA